jgi:hypothetical protein
MLSRDLKKIGDDGFLPTAKLWHNVLLAKFVGSMFAENFACGSRRYETLCIELCGSPRNRYTLWSWINMYPVAAMLASGMAEVTCSAYNL